MLGELYVVGEGEVQVSTVQDGLEKQTGAQRQLLCTKRKGDMIWVPHVRRLAHQLSKRSKFGRGSIVRIYKHKQLDNLITTTTIQTIEGAVLLKVRITPTEH
jgi:hypothetical protein